VQHKSDLKLFFYLNVIQVHALINNSYNKTNKCTNVKIIFLHTIYHYSNMFQSILIIFMELLNISKAYLKTWVDY